MAAITRSTRRRTSGSSRSDCLRPTSSRKLNASFARAFLPDRDPVGERFTFGDRPEDDGEWITIVGVVEDAQRWGLGQPLRPYVFFPMWQFMNTRASVVVRTSGDPEALAGSVREVLRAVDPSLPLTELHTL